MRVGSQVTQPKVSTEILCRRLHAGKIVFSWIPIISSTLPGGKGDARARETHIIPRLPGLVPPLRPYPHPFPYSHHKPHMRAEQGSQGPRTFVEHSPGGQHCVLSALYVINSFKSFNIPVKEATLPY